MDVSAVESSGILGGGGGTSKGEGMVRGPEGLLGGLGSLDEERESERTFEEVSDEDGVNSVGDGISYKWLL